MAKTAKRKLHRNDFVVVMATGVVELLQRCRRCILRPPLAATPREFVLQAWWCGRVEDEFCALWWQRRWVVEVNGRTYVVAFALRGWCRHGGRCCSSSSALERAHGRNPLLLFLLTSTVPTDARTLATIRENKSRLQEYTVAYRVWIDSQETGMGLCIELVHASILMQPL